MTSTRSSSRKGSSPTAPLSRIPVFKGSKASAKGATTTTTTTRQRRKVAVVSDSTRVLRSSIGHTPTGANKENIPFFPRRRFLSRANLTSPSRMRRDGSGKKPFGRPGKVQRPKRQPLRELTEAEIFERDEAVMGDLRRRRASGDSYIVESSIEVTFDSSLAQDSTVQAATPSDLEQSAPVEPESPLIVLRPAIEKFQIFRTTDSEEKLQSDGVVNTIIAAAATAASTSIDYENRPMTRAALAQKQQHPSIRTSLSSIENNSPDVMLRSAEATPINPLRARATRFSSPCSGTMVHAGVSKAQASPSPLKVSRKGLGTKSTNTVMKKVLEEGGKLEGSKFVMKDTTTTSKTAAKKRTVTTTTTTMKESKATARKASSSLKRAAGVNTTVSTSARAGLANIGRMR